MRYPDIEPYDHGMLAVGDGNLVYWEVCGNPVGKPALVLHGGPGTGCSANSRRYFDPEKYRVVLFDQRGCGRSTPNAGDPAVDLSVNTTQHQVADIESLREFLGIERWLVYGGSWGCVLGLHYAERFPHRVSEIVMMGIATGQRAEVDLLINGLGRIFPEAWQRFRAGVPAEYRDGNLATAYAKLLAHPDPAVHRKAADDWCAWEDAIVPTAPPRKSTETTAWRMTFARLVTHYFGNDHFLPDGVVLAEANRLAGIPGVLVQGALDFGNLLGTPWELASRWPSARLRLIDDTGHDMGGGMRAALVDATDRFAVGGW
ncbi:MAG: prolyl aminopeptidase [Sciscionella sp.]|nr:prolyl aminopeptidase [Sciscionella sp.]